MRRLFNVVSATIALATLTALTAACSGGGGTPGPVPSPIPSASPTPVGLTAIKHIVIIVQENRTFDNLFNGYPGADTA